MDTWELLPKGGKDVSEEATGGIPEGGGGL